MHALGLLIAWVVRDSGTPRELVDRNGGCRGRPDLGLAPVENDQSAIDAPRAGAAGELVEVSRSDDVDLRRLGVPSYEGREDLCLRLGGVAVKVDKHVRDRMRSRRVRRLQPFGD